MSWDPFFTEAYYRKERPVWADYAPELFGASGTSVWLIVRLIGFGLALGAVLAIVLRMRGRKI